MTKQHKRDRMRWALRFLRNNFDWNTALFADEKVWYLDGPEYRPLLWQDRRDAPRIVPRTGARNVKVHVWGAFSVGCTPDLVVLEQPFNSQEYIRTLQDAQLTTGGIQQCVLFHDRHPVHKSFETNNWLTENGVQTQLFPAKAADINPIENLWAAISSQVYPQNKTYSSKAELLAAIQAAWRSIQADAATRARYVNSMPSRLEEVVVNKGGLTQH
jgi:hypothetical protein